MITALAQIISGYLIKNKIIDNTKLDIYIYGFEIMISNIICFGMGLVIGAVCSEFIECILFLIVFILLRRYCGGYHAETYLKCDIIFMTNILLVMLMLKFISAYSLFFHFIIAIISIIFIIQLATVENKYKPLKKKEKKRHKILAIITNILIISVSSAMYFIITKFALTIDISVTTVVLSMGIEVLKKGSVKNEKYEKSNS